MLTNSLVNVRTTGQILFEISMNKLKIENLYSVKDTNFNKTGIKSTQKTQSARLHSDVVHYSSKVG
jgi:hypothetical protein